MKIVIFGLTITSAWGNGHATTYRSLLKALADRNHFIVFIEKDVEWYRSNRDLPHPKFCSVVLYNDWVSKEKLLIREARDADAIIVGSYFPDAIAATHSLLEADCGPIYFYDIDTPITIAQLRQHGACEYLDAALIPNYAAYLSFTGGPMLYELEHRFGARSAIPFYCSVDPNIYKPGPSLPEFACDLSYLGTYARDRQHKLMSLLGGASQQMPDGRFIVAGAMYPDETMWNSNVRRFTHVAPPEHPAFYSSSRYTLNLTREDMVLAGWSPSVRLFEASACRAAILSDKWDGLENFFTPGEEIFVPKDASEVAVILQNTSEEERNAIASRARDRVLSEHTSDQRARQFETIVSSSVIRSQSKAGEISHTLSALSTSLA